MKQVSVKLTDADLKLIRMIASGMQNKEIMEKLDIEMWKMNYLIAGLYSKLGVKNRAQLSVFAAKRGLDK